MYDAAGNLMADGSLTMTYDAENRMVSTNAGVSYFYDGDGRRVKKSTGKLYWYGASGLDALVETDLAGNTPTEFVFFGGKRIARRDSGGAISYFFADHLGSSRVLTNSSGTVVEDSDFYPFGGERVVVNNDPNQYKFTGKERDTESGLDYFSARYFASQQGRFLSSDPGPLREHDPQSLNRFAYVRNNPIRLVDATGEYWIDTVVISGKTYYRAVRETSPASSALGNFAPWAKIIDRSDRMRRGDSNNPNLLGYVKFVEDEINKLDDSESYFLTSAVSLDREIFAAFAEEFGHAETDHGGITTVLLGNQRDAQDFAQFHTAYRYAKEIRELQAKLEKTTDSKKREKLERDIRQRRESKEYKKFGERAEKHVAKSEEEKKKSEEEEK